MTDTTAPRFYVTYRVTPDDNRPIEQHAMDICIEDTVEIPQDTIPEGHWKAGIVGRTESITARGGSPADFDVVISYRTDITSNAIPNFINVLFGNISMRRGIKVIDITFTDEQLKAFGGPRFGVDGIRAALGVHGRPLATTAIKPLALPLKELAAKCLAYARGGLDIIKDDHGLMDQAWHPFKERVSRFMDAVRDGNAKGGTRTHYYPMVSGRFEEIESQAAHAKAEGCAGILVAPMLVGMDTGFYLGRKYGLAVMTHPSFTGLLYQDPRYGMSLAMFMGTLFRLFGSDISVFANMGGRFTPTKPECLELADALRRPMGGLKAAFPSPAGGMTIAQIGTMVDMYGIDTALLIGGDLMRYSPDGEVSARAFIAALEKAVAQRKGA